jgi:hypothetical protein
LLESVLGFQGVLLIPPVDGIDPLDCALVAGGHLDLLVCCLLLSLLLALVELHQFLFQLSRAFFLLLPFLPFLFLVPPINFFQMFLIKLGFLGQLFVFFSAVGFILVSGGLDLSLELAAC